MKETHFFLGSNAPTGFVSLYDGFTSPARDQLHIIKGFPGCGKSTFMRRIADALTAEGCPAEYIHCSGDPDSLDGVYFPTLHVGYADGTAPHVTEPRIGGASEDYVNLGAFCDTEALREARGEIARLTEAYRREYDKAYAFLAAAAAVRRAYAPDYSAETVARAARRAKSSLAHRVGNKHYVNPTATYRFLSAVTCRREVCFYDTIRTLADTVVILDNECGLAPVFTAAAAAYLEGRGLDTLRLLDPEAPEIIEHLAVPALRLAFVTEDRSRPWPYGGARHIRLDAFPGQAELKTALPALRAMRREAAALTDGAVEHLAAAKQLHDELERCYIPHVDFGAVGELAREHGKRLLDVWTKTEKGV